MALFLKKIMKRTVAATGIQLGIAKRIDYKTLNRYIIGMNECLTLDHVLLEASRCLKDILNYQLFAFAVQDRNQLDVWIDPRIYEQSISTVIERDFGSSSAKQVHFFTDENHGRPDAERPHTSGLLSHEILNAGTIARLYVLPQRRMMSYHDEILSTIVKTLGVALYNCLNIKRLESHAALDPLTGCYNRREFDRLIAHHIAGARRHHKALSLIMFDIDHFKQVNDTFGHPAGDAVLTHLAAAVRSAVRKEDYLVRYGGEEFAVMLPETEFRRAVELAERLRRIVELLHIRLPNGRAIRKTASFGVATLRKGWDAGRLVKEADHLLYRAKALGRNMVMPKLALCPQGNLADMIEYGSEEFSSYVMP